MREWFVMRVVSDHSAGLAQRVVSRSLKHMRQSWLVRGIFLRSASEQASSESSSRDLDAPNSIIGWDKGIYRGNARGVFLDYLENGHIRYTFGHLIIERLVRRAKLF